MRGYGDDDDSNLNGEINIVHEPTQHVEADTRYLPKWCSQWTPWQRPPPGNATGTRHDGHADDVVDDSTGGSRHANDARHVCRWPPDVPDRIFP